VTVGFIMLCHTALERAAQIARTWADQGCPIVLHIDSNAGEAAITRLKTDLADLPQVRFVPSRRCEWGTFSLVEATQDAAAVMLAEFPRVRHVFLASGSCFPLRPVAELEAHLAARPDTDFIESVTTADVGWTIGGLDVERFTLRFPFSWRRHRRLFDAYVRVQRSVGFKRRIPVGLVPHLGSQWWCLTRRTLKAIIDHPRRAEFDRYFRRVWIPDESYFQTLVRLVSDHVESRSLTLSKFDHLGKPHVFYDDHLPLLRKSDCFVARKAWPHAERLYQAFLDPVKLAAVPVTPDPGKIDRLFAKAVERRTRGRPGLFNQSRFPLGDTETPLTAAPYTVLEGFGALFENFDDWLRRVSGVAPHGHLFAPDRVGFSGGVTSFSGALSDSASLRDYNPQSFLTNLIWNTRGARQVFRFGPEDTQEIAGFLARDANAQVLAISGAWAVPLFRSGRPVADLRAVAARLQRTDMAHLALLRQPQVKARVRIWTLADVVETPMEPLQVLLDELTPRSPTRLTEAPRMVDLRGFGRFLQGLRNQGMQPMMMGEFPPDAEENAPEALRAPLAGRD
jgi:hypothetical protein